MFPSRNVTHMLQCTNRVLKNWDHCGSVILSMLWILNVLVVVNIAIYHVSKYTMYLTDIPATLNAFALYFISILTK